jgi:hypothetical protein
MPVYSRLLFAVAAGTSTLLADPASKPIYALAYNPTPGSRAMQLGTFDLNAPTGTAGSYSYAWTSLGGPLAETAKNLALQPGTNQLYLTYGDSETTLRTISATGVVGDPIGTLPGGTYGMVFQADGSLRAVDIFGSDLLTIDPATGTISATTETAGFYSSYSGNLTSVGNTLYWANIGFGEPPESGLHRVGPDQFVGAFSTNDPQFDEYEFMNLFAWDADLYLLNADILYQVSTTDGALTRLGTVTGLPSGYNSFTGAVGNAVTAVPEPSTYGLLLGVGALALAASRRRSRRGK